MEDNENAVTVAQTTEITSFDELAGAPAAMDDTVKAMITGTRLPRISLMSSQSAAVKTGQCGMNVFAVTDASKAITELGKTVQVVPIKVRALAIDQSNPKETLFLYNTTTPDFQRVQEAAAAVKSGLSDFMCGPQYLVWLPEHGIFATYYLQNYSGRCIAPTMQGLIGKCAELSMESRTSKKNNTIYMAPVLKASAFAFDRPDLEELNAVVKAFVSEKDSNELAEGEEAAPETTQAR